jgi:hypothetical protein
MSSDDNTVVDLLDDNGAWRVDRLAEYFRPVDIEAILKIGTSPRMQQDFIAWQPEKSGYLSVRSAYHLAVATHINNVAGGAASSRPSGDRPAWKLVWFSPLPQKMKIFAWKVISGALATYSNKKRRHLEVIDTCRICGTATENSFHALVECPNATKVWDSMREVWALPTRVQIRDTGHEWLFDLLASQSVETRNMIIMILWRIWQLRNDILHDKPNPPTDVTRRYLCSYFGSLFQIRQQNEVQILKGKAPCVLAIQPKCDKRRQNQQWPKPEPGRLALSVDGSFDAEGRAGTGMVLRDSNEGVIFSAYRSLLNCNEGLEAKISAIMEGMSLALEW